MRRRSSPLFVVRATLFIAEKGFSAAAAMARIAREVLEEPPPDPSGLRPERPEAANGGPPTPATEPEPWTGYAATNAADIRARLAGADAETAGAVKLYEASHKGRRTVIEAAERRLRG